MQATDDQNRSSTADETFQYDLTLSALAVPHSASDGLQVGFTLSRPASAVLADHGRQRHAVTTLPAVNLSAGTQSLSWDVTTAPARTPRLATTSRP